jgi:hypothetical protein
MNTFPLVIVAGLLSCSCSDESPGKSQESGPGPGNTSGGESGAVSGAGGSTSTGSGGTATGGAGMAGAAGGFGGGGSAGTGGTGTAGSGGVGGAPSGGAGGSAGSGGSGGATPTFHVFLLLGQSNMAGYSKAEDADKVENPRIRVLGFDDCAATGRVKDEWDVAVPPLHECWNGALGPGDYFAKTLIEELSPEDTIGLVPCAISGEQIETFQKTGGSKYSWIVDRAKLAQQAGGVIEGILFHQGESNCTDPNWPGKVKTLVTDLRNDLALGDAPFVAGELPPTGNCSGHNTLVNELPELIPNAFVVSAAGLAVDPADTTWNLHFDHDSQVTFGERYAATMKQALGL